MEHVEICEIAILRVDAMYSRNPMTPVLSRNRPGSWEAVAAVASTRGKSRVFQNLKLEPLSYKVSFHCRVDKPRRSELYCGSCWKSSRMCSVNTCRKLWLWGSPKVIKDLYYVILRYLKSQVEITTSHISQPQIVSLWGWKVSIWHQLHQSDQRSWSQDTNRHK